MVTVGDKILIEKLESAVNWRKWKMLIQLLLKKHCLIDIVFGKSVKPIEPDIDREKWESNDADAMLYIPTTLGEEPSTLLMTCSNIATHVAKLQRYFAKLNDSLLQQNESKFSDRVLIERILSTLGPAFHRTIKTLIENLRNIEQRDNVELQKTREEMGNSKRGCYQTYL
ncbi:hypothetical protein RN001_005549 [Aquatica leii]|uniref:Uncharacterized protein n=1 Tax=Aquatica leii TaxID=1421715 RepID=A0AAN7Q7D5_9COLE|nr:hypothetical protein RN001_005549 [Aquatica leii]